MRLNHSDSLFPRSILSPLEPIGLGTSSAESVESYVQRLAKEHRVTRYHIESFVSKSGPTPLYQGISRQPIRLDSPIHNAKEFTRRLSLLTCTPAVETMGLGWLTARVASMGALRNQRAWCPQCIGKTEESGTAGFLPLAWSLTAYEICAEHSCAIQTSCPSCRKGIDVRREWSWPFSHCPHCDSPFGRAEFAAANSLRDFERRKVREADQRASKHLGELISRAPEMRNYPMLESPDIHRLVKSGIARRKADHQSNLANLAGISKGTLHRLTEERTSRPTLDVLTRLAAVTDTSIVGTLCPGLWKVGPDTDNTRIAMMHSSRRGRSRLSWDEIGHAVDKEIGSPRPVSPSTLAHRLQIDASNLRKRLPKTVANLAEVCRKQLTFERQSNQTKLAAQMTEFIHTRTATGKRISLRSVSKALNVRRWNTDVQVAWSKCQTDIC